MFYNNCREPYNIINRTDFSLYNATHYFYGDRINADELPVTTIIETDEYLYYIAKEKGEEASTTVVTVQASDADAEAEKNTVVIKIIRKNKTVTTTSFWGVRQKVDH